MACFGAGKAHMGATKVQIWDAACEKEQREHGLNIQPAASAAVLI